MESSEFEAFKAVHDALVDLDAERRARVIKSVATLLDVADFSAPDKERLSGSEGPLNATTVETKAEAEVVDFEYFAELFDATDPKTGSEKALVAAYWLQEIEGTESFTAQSVNGLLKDLGHKLANVTDALSSLINQKPQLVLQLKKSGTSKQARKLYKLSAAGLKQVTGMMHEGG